MANKDQKYFKQCISVQLNRKSVNNSVSNKKGKGKGKQANISRILPPISLQLSKSVLAKSKFFKGNQELKLNKQSNKSLYTQASKYNVQNFLKIKNVFPKLSLNKISEIYNVMSNLNKKDKLKFNITTKDLSRK